jgi:hypothetical protein
MQSKTKPKGTVDRKKDGQPATREPQQYLNYIPYEAREELICVDKIVVKELVRKFLCFSST